MKNSLWKEILGKCFGREKDERWNAVAMLIIFSFFLGILIIMLRMGGATPNENNSHTTPSFTPTLTPTPTTDSGDVDLGQEKESGNYEINYSYLYTFTSSAGVETVTGKRLDQKEIFTIITQIGSTDYARVSDNYLQKENGKYHLVEMPSRNLIYANLDPLISILEELTPNINLNQYTYYVPTSMLLSAYHKDLGLIDSSDTYNTVIVTRNSNTIEAIEADYSSLSTLLNGTTNSYTIHMEFNHVGTTEDFTISE